MGERDDGSDISARLMAERLAEAEERACHAQPKGEPSSLMARLEAVEQAGRDLAYFADHLASALGLPTGPGLTPSLDEIENRISALRLAEADASSLRAERVQVEEAAGVVVGAVTLGELLRKIRESVEYASEYILLIGMGRASCPGSPSPGLAPSLPEPEALPVAYAFLVAEYVSDLADRLMGAAFTKEDPHAE